MRIVSISFNEETKEFGVSFNMMPLVYYANMSEASAHIANWLIEGVLPEKKG